MSDFSTISDLYMVGEMNVWVENATIYIQSSADGLINLYDIAAHCRIIEINAGITTVNVAPGLYIINNKKIIVK